MPKGIPEKLTNHQLEALSKILGSAPVLRSEDATHYNQIWENLLKILVPRDFMELLLIRQAQNETWKIMRYTRHQTVGIDRHFRQSLEFQVKRKQMQNARREALAQELARKGGKPQTDLERISDLEDTIDSSVVDVDEILDRLPTEFDHNRALEGGILFEEQLDKLINSAIRRRNDAFEQLELYRQGLGEQWRRISDEIIDGEATEIEETKQIDAPAIVPTPGNDNPALVSEGNVNSQGESA